MKKLILTALLVSTSTYALATMDEMVTGDDSNQIAAVVKDIEIQKMLEKTSEFKSCRDMYPFAASDGPNERKTKISNAQQCFKKKVGDEKNKERLQELSDTLNLQGYGLVRSKNTKDIQSYLDKKMYKALTGVDYETMTREQIINKLKFKNKKHIDQKIFISMWKTQLTKNSLYEISNFCLTKLRREPPIPQPGQPAPPTPPNTFGAYWGKNFDPNTEFVDQSDPQKKMKVAAFTDTGEPKFDGFPNADDKDKIYEDVFNTLQMKDFPADKLSDFFLKCGQMITPMCDSFKNPQNNTIDLNNTQSYVATTNSNPTKGAAACLMRSRLQSYKKALAETQLYEKYFEQLANDGKTDSLMRIVLNGDASVYGNSTDDASLDDLTNHTTQDVIGSDLKDEKTENCLSHPEDPACEKQFLGDQEEFLKAQTNIETELTLKREVEMQRVREMKLKNDAKLEDYLKDNGYYDILKQSQDNNWDAEQLATAIGKEFEAKKIGVLEELQNKLGNRQVKKDAKAADKETAVNLAATETKQERARLAQVVLFNNIITSHLELSRDVGGGKFESAGRNVNAWKKEEQVLKTGGVNETYFSNLKVTGTGNDQSQVGQDDQFGGLNLIETILGKEAK